MYVCVCERERERERERVVIIYVDIICLRIHPLLLSLLYYK